MNIIINKYKVNIRTGGYETNNKNYPTFLLIHGAGMDGSI